MFFAQKVCKENGVSDWWHLLPLWVLRVLPVEETQCDVWCIGQRMVQDILKRWGMMNGDGA